jgi:hypothetical protein
MRRTYLSYGTERPPGVGWARLSRLAGTWLETGRRAISIFEWWRVGGAVGQAGCGHQLAGALEGLSGWAGSDDANVLDPAALDDGCLTWLIGTNVVGIEPGPRSHGCG